MDLALALGGGGAKGNSHIGVLRLLENEKFSIRAIAGTSFGGMVACFYAVGYTPDEIEAIFSTVDQSRLYDREKDESSSFLGLGRVKKWLEHHLGERTFGDLKIPCAVTAVNLRTSEEVIIKNGTLKDAILATIALPGIFPSFMSGELELVDGGLLNPVPVSLARSLAPSLPVVAVSLGTPLGQPARSLSMPIMDNLPSALAVPISNLRIAKAVDIFMRSIDIGGRQITELRFEIEKPDVIIHPAVEEIGVLDRVDVKAVARLGELATRAKLPDLKRVTSRRERFLHRIFGKGV